MKLLFENWRKFITEMEEPITTLRIFDFDETIAHTESETRVTAPDGTETTMRNQQEFEEYMSAAAAKEGNSLNPGMSHGQCSCHWRPAPGGKHGSQKAAQW